MKEEKEAERQVSILFNTVNMSSSLGSVLGGVFKFFFFFFSLWFPLVVLSVPASLPHFLGNVVRLTLDPYSGPHPTHQGPSCCEGGEASL
jgi:hypothetical protein